MIDGQTLNTSLSICRKPSDDMGKKVVFFFFCVAISICLMAKTVEAMVGWNVKTNGKRVLRRVTGLFHAFYRLYYLFTINTRELNVDVAVNLPNRVVLRRILRACTSRVWKNPNRREETLTGTRIQRKLTCAKGEQTSRSSFRRRD